MKNVAPNLSLVLREIRNCRLCASEIPEPRPVLRAKASAKILVIGQAPGTKVHASGIPWNDASGKRLREWMAVDEQTFYDDTKIAIVPMGFCYPGKGNGGDLPPRPECAPTWHDQVISLLPDIKCTLLIGMYAQNYYLDTDHENLTERVKSWREFAPEVFVLPHPSPRNQLWLRRNDWFEQETVPALQETVQQIL
ncbi:MAG: uracil-DNA glycosylase family protein [Pseudomonadales bacterium]|nr:uracil-DNA glycosylase family protein [Pseudomonadales bacterium]